MQQVFLCLIIATFAYGQIRQEAKCTNAGGTCMYETSCTQGTLLTNYCPNQATNVKCCVPKAGTSTGAGTSSASTVTDKLADCSKNKAQCTNPYYISFMKEKCPKTCGYTTTTTGSGTSTNTKETATNTKETSTNTGGSSTNTKETSTNTGGSSTNTGGSSTKTGEGSSSSKSTGLVKSVCEGAVEKMRDVINDQPNKPTADFLAKTACSIRYLNKIGSFCHKALGEVAEFTLKETEKNVEDRFGLDGESICKKVGFHDDELKNEPEEKKSKICTLCTDVVDEIKDKLLDKLNEKLMEKFLKESNEKLLDLLEKDVNKPMARWLAETVCIPFEAIDMVPTGITCLFTAYEVADHVLKKLEELALEEVIEKGTMEAVENTIANQAEKWIDSLTHVSLDAETVCHDMSIKGHSPC